MKKQFILLLTAVALLVSCSNDNTNFEGETVQVSFCAEIPQAMGTRAASNLVVNKLVCAVFDENDNEIATLRETINIEDGQDPVFSPRLIKGNSYKIAFWAMKAGAYDVTYMTNISRNDGYNEADYDAFTYATEIEVLNSDQKEVTLTRPFALLNVGISSEDWEAVENTFGLTPTTTVVKYSGKKYFNALSGAPVETAEDEEISHTMHVGGEAINVNGKTYKSIASCYILPYYLPFQTTDVKSLIYFTIIDQNDKVIRSNVGIPSVTLQSNYKTNIVGSILTGTVSYEISIKNDFDGDKENINIQ